MELPKGLLCLVIIYNIWIVSAQECANENDFNCRITKICIDSSLVCDKKYDCADRSDEENCSKYSAPNSMDVLCYAYMHVGSHFLMFKPNFQAVMHRNGTNVKMEHVYHRACDVMAIMIVPLKMMRPIAQTMSRITRLPNAQKMSLNVILTVFAFPLS